MNVLSNRPAASFRPSLLRQLVSRFRQRVAWPESNYLLNAKRKFLYCPIQKIACSSLMRAFLGTHGRRDEEISDPHEEVLEHQLARFSPSRVQEILQDRSFFTFAFVRNPWARLVSAYLNLLMSRNEVSEPVLQFVHSRRTGEEIRPGDWTDLTFNEFLDFLASGNPRTYNVHWKPQVLFFQGNRIDFIGRFERLGNDFEVIRERLGIDSPLPRVNSTKYVGRESGPSDYVADAVPRELLDLPALPNYRAFYSRGTRDLVSRIYGRDIETFGYRFEE